MFLELFLKLVFLSEKFMLENDSLRNWPIDMVLYQDPTILTVHEQHVKEVLKFGLRSCSGLQDVSLYPSGSFEAFRSGSCERFSQKVSFQDCRTPKFFELRSSSTKRKLRWQLWSPVFNYLELERLARHKSSEFIHGNACSKIIPKKEKQIIHFFEDQKRFYDV